MTVNLPKVADNRTGLRPGLYLVVPLSGFAKPDGVWLTDVFAKDVGGQPYLMYRPPGRENDYVATTASHVFYGPVDDAALATDLK